MAEADGLEQAEGRRRPLVLCDSDGRTLERMVFFVSSVDSPGAGNSLVDGEGRTIERWSGGLITYWHSQ